MNNIQDRIERLERKLCCGKTVWEDALIDFPLVGKEETLLTRKNLGWNYRQAVIKSLLASVAVLMLPLKFVIVEGVWIVTFISGIRIATQPLLSREENDLEAPIVEDNTGSIIRTYFLDKKI